MLLCSFPPFPLILSIFLFFFELLFYKLNMYTYIYIYDCELFLNRVFVFIREAFIES